MAIDDKIKIFDAEDSKLKILGELLSNDTSRKIIRMLIRKECYTNEISKKLNIRVSLVIHHLKKLEQIGVLVIIEKPIVRKGNDHRYFRMVPGLFLAPNHTKEEIDKSGFLKKIFREGIKFTCVGIAFIGSSIISKNHFKSSETNYPASFGVDIPHDAVNSLEFWIYPLMVLVVALIIERIIFGIKKRKKG